MKNWKPLLASVAPAIATALGGPLAGAATRALGQQLVGKPEATDDEIAAQLTGADAATLLKLKELDVQFRKDMEQAGIDLEKLATEDRAGARSREIALHDWVPAVLAMLTITLFGLIEWQVLTRTLTETARAAVEPSLRVVETLLTFVFGYYFGSSSGSSRKTEIMGAGGKA